MTSAEFIKEFSEWCDKKGLKLSVHHFPSDDSFKIYFKCNNMSNTFLVKGNMTLTPLLVSFGDSKEEIV